MPMFLFCALKTVGLNNSCSTWSEICFGFNKCLSLGLYYSLYSYAIYFCLSNSDTASYAGDNTPYYTDQNIKEVTDDLKKTI